MALLKRKRSGLADPMSVVTRFVNACNRHDAEAVSQCLHAEFDSIQPMFPARNFRGADQVRRNWQAIFDAEPGFRLTVLRQAAADETVWLELHGAGEEAEVAGVFVMGIEGDRVRWARIYSGLVEPLPPGYEEAAAVASPAPLREVPPLGEDGAARTEPVVEEDLIAPVLDIDGGERRRRRRASRRRGQEEVAADEAPADEVVPSDTAEAEVPADDGGWAALSEEPAPAGEAEAVEPAAVDEAVDEGPATMLVEPDSLATGPHPPVVVEPEPTAGDGGDAVVAEEDLVVPEAEPLLAEPVMEPEPEAAAAEPPAEPEPVPAEPEVVAVEAAPPAAAETAVVEVPVVEVEDPARTDDDGEPEPDEVAPLLAWEPAPEAGRPNKWLGRRRR